MCDDEDVFLRSVGGKNSLARNEVFNSQPNIECSRLFIKK